ncbi:MAG TPA: IPT/TIG domain-containing protein [Candidatus Angelobacter sp.]
MKKASLFFAFVSMLVISSLSSFAQQLVINSLVPSSGAIGDQVTITGSGFRDTQAPQSVGFNGIIAPVVSWSDTIIVVMVPTGVPLGDASVSVKGPRGFGFSNAVTFSVKPGVGQLSPSVGPVGAPVTVAGTNFGDSQGSSTITLGGVSLTPSQWTDPQISVTVPAGFPAGSAELVVTVNGLSSAPQPLLVIPVIISDSPAEASVGTPATLTGSSFGGQQGQSTLTFNGVPAIPSAWSDTSITAPVPVGATTGPLVVTVNGLATNGLPFNVQPKITSLGPASGAVNSLVTITGTTFGQTQGFGSVTFNGLNAVVQSWSDSAISVFVPPNATTGNIVVTTGILLTSNGVNFAVINPLAVGPGIQLSISDTPLQINLTSPQVLDWIHWGRVSTTVPDRKDGIAPLISDFTALSGSQATTSSGNIAFSWTDGNHPAQVSEATEDIKTFTTGGGFLITVPADTTVKTLNLYAEVIAGQGILHASLSDGSAADINDQTVVDSDIGNKVYSVDFRAASAGQTLTVSFSGTASTSGVGLQAATLTPHLPTVMIGAPATAQQFVAPGSIPVNISADQFGSSISDVKATGSEGTVLDNAGSPLNSNLGPLAGGHYSVTGTAIDTTGLIGTSTPVEFDVIGQGGTLSIDEVPPSSPIDLDTEGSGDWILWGSGSGNIYARKSGVGPLISNYKPIGNHPITSLLGAHNLCFSGDQQSYCTDEVTVHGQGNGFEITVAADTTPRTLQLYVGRLSADGLVTAFLSDGSAPVATEVGGVGPPESSTTLYTINFSAASAGQTLTVRFTLNSDQGNGQISLIGAAVNGNSVAPLGPAPQITAISPNSAPANTKVTIAGSNFGATQGTGGVYFGELNAQIVNWSDTSLDAMVPAGLGDGSSAQVVVITPNGTSNPVSFHVAAFQVYPPSLSIVVGQSGLVTPKDSSHNVVSGLNWFTTDPSIVSVSADDPAIITGLAPGIATVYAGDVPFQVTVYAGASLPPGTALWSVPLSPGATQITSVVPAVPGDSGADVLALDDARNLSAYSSDGELLWTQPVPVCLGAALPNCAFTKVFPDFSGNIFISQISDIFRTTKMDNSISPPKLLTFSHLTQTISKLNIQTGQLTDFYTFQGADEGNGSGNFVDSPSDRAIPSPAGVLFIQDVPKVTVFDPATAQPIVTIDLERTTFANGAPDQDPVSGQMIVAGD